MKMSTTSEEPKSVQVRRMIDIVNAEKARGKTSKQIAEAHPEYERDFPRIFSLVNQNGNYPKDILEMMITQLEKIENGNRSQHDASVAVGSVLVDRFVKPQLGLK